MATDASSRAEARRRRIVERGSDRFALITGRATLPNSPSAYSYSNSDPSLAPIDLVPDEETEPSPSLLSSQAFGSAKNKNLDFLTEFTQRYMPSTPKSEANAEPSDPSSQDQSSHVSPKSPTQTESSSETTHNFEPQTRRYSFCSPRKISSAVSSSESSRMHCVIAIALLVILSYIGVHTLGYTIVKNMILFRPLYLLLITNISIVAAHVLDGPEQQVMSTPPPSDDGYGLANIANALEIGILLQKAAGALFMDCSIYSVIVVCGLSVAKRFGW